MNNNIYPNLPAIAAHFQVSVISIVKYEVWSNCFFVKIIGIGYRFVSKSFTRGVVKATTQKPQPQPSLYRVVKTWDNGSSWYGDRVISVLVQPVDNSEKPYWESVFLHQGIQRGDLLREGSGGRLVKANR